MSKLSIPDKMTTGLITGLIIPVIVFLGLYIFTAEGESFSEFLGTINDKDLVTHFISISVFPNVFAFLIFNRLDKLRSSRGVLGITIIWALLVFGIKIF